MMILNGLKQIAEFVGCGRDRVRELKRAGAPIRVTGRGDGRRYLADSEALRAWASNVPAPSRT